MLPVASRKREPIAVSLSGVSAFTSKSQEKHAWRCFMALLISIFLNFLLAILNKNGVSMNTQKVTAIQIIVTVFCGLLLFSKHAKFNSKSILALFLILFFTLCGNLIYSPNVKTFYDFLIIPLYIFLGTSAFQVREKWMSYMFWFVALIVGTEVLFPSIYRNVVDPGGFFMATREWLAERHVENDAVRDGLYAGAYRGGGSIFAIADHRVSGPFLEPLSLGYFSVLMSLYFLSLHKGSIFYRLICVGTCIFFSLLSDSRAASALIIVGIPFILARPKIPSIFVWSTMPIVFMLAWLMYFMDPSFLVGDMFSRIALTFAGLRQIGVGQLLIGGVPTNSVQDSGILYMTHWMGPIGMFLAVWYYCGLFSRKNGTNSAIFVMTSLYVSTTLMFGGALFSIKTASLLGFLVGLASIPRTIPFPKQSINRLLHKKLHQQETLSQIES